MNLCGSDNQYTTPTQWGKYLNKLVKLMLWSSKLLNLQYYKHNLLSYLQLQQSYM